MLNKENKDLIWFMQSLSRVRQNQASERKVLLSEQQQKCFSLFLSWLTDFLWQRYFQQRKRLWYRVDLNRSVLERWLYKLDVGVWRLVVWRKFHYWKQHRPGSKQWYDFTCILVDQRKELQDHAQWRPWTHRVAANHRWMPWGKVIQA